MRLLFTVLACLISVSLFGQGACNNQTSITYHGHEYDIVEIGDQCWFAENCRYLPEVSSSDSVSWSIPNYYVYGYEGTDTMIAKSTINYNSYGVLYNWSAVITQDLCPSGWHVPSDLEWNELEVQIGLPFVEATQTFWRGDTHGIDMKSVQLWQDEGNGTNESGFNCLPSGIVLISEFEQLLSSSFFWTSSIASTNEAWMRHLRYNEAGVNRMTMTTYHGLSVRCLKNTPDVILGCLDSNAFNYNPAATQSDASCLYDIDYVTDSNTTYYNNGYEDGIDAVDCSNTPFYNDCAGDYTGDGSVTVSDLLEFLILFGNQCE